jgi:hypothetical protein
MEKRTYVVPTQNLAKLDSEFAHFVERMERLAKRKQNVVFNLPKLIKSEPRAIPQGFNALTHAKKPDLIVVDVTIEGEPTKVPGYQFVATLEHVEGADGKISTIVRVVPTAEVAPQEFINFRTVESKCDHCHADRNRKDTFLVRREADKALLQVGRNCLRDFFGHDPSWAVRECEFLGSLDDLLSASEGDGWGGSNVSRKVNLHDFLPWVVSCIRLKGWTSRTKARELYDVRATADLAGEFAFPPFRPSEFFYREREKFEPTPADEEVANKALAYAREKFEDADPVSISDYEHNLSVVVGCDYVDFRKLGLAASLITFFDRELAKREEHLKDEISQHFGTVGKREVFNLTLVKIFATVGMFGPTTIYKFKDIAGNIATWFSTANIDRLEIGKTYAVKGTVKKHGEFRGVKQTVLNRCIIEEEGR